MAIVCRGFGFRETLTGDVPPFSHVLVRREAEFGLPRTLFKPFSLPVSLRQQYDAGDFRVTARLEDPEVLIRPEYLRFGFRAR